jgi:anti-sigma regulatory factor (Ser/Thr protein kinase)
MTEAARSLRLTAELSSLASATGFAEEGARLAGLPDDSLDQVHLVVEELFMNIARYAYPPSSSGPVEIHYFVPEPGVLRMQIADRGAQYDPLAAEEPELGSRLRDRKVGGLGVFLVRQLTRMVSYRRDGDWNRIEFEIQAPPGSRFEE